MEETTSIPNPALELNFIVPGWVGFGVNGQRDLLVGGQLISLLADR